MTDMVTFEWTGLGQFMAYYIGYGFLLTFFIYLTMTPLGVFRWWIKQARKSK